MMPLFNRFRSASVIVSILFSAVVLTAGSFTGEPGKLIVGIGASTDATRWGMPGEVKEALLESGAHSIRVPNHGSYEVINDNVSFAFEHKISVLFMLGYQESKAFGDVPGPETEAGRQEYADRSARIAKHFGDKVLMYEVWNEWTGGMALGSWDKAPANQPEIYVDLLRRVRKAVKEVNPKAQIGGPVMPSLIDGNAKWREGFYAAGGLDLVDFVDVHVYALRRRTQYGLSAGASVKEAAEVFYKRLAMLDGDIRKVVGKSIPMIVSEEGVPSDPTLSEEAQADYLRLVYQGGINVPYLAGLYWYVLPQQRVTAQGEHAPGWGLLTADFRKKPGYYAFKEMATSIPSGMPFPAQVTNAR